LAAPQLLDACVLINLLASDEIEAILLSAARESFICAAVEGESIYLRTEDANAPIEHIDLAPSIDGGLLTVCNIYSDAEVELYVDYASVLNDGEAMSLAIALSRNYMLATDEKKARRLFLEATGNPMRLASTSALIRHWSEDNISGERLKHVLLNVETRARYQPPTTDVNYRWWLDASR
jgi:predicted nucleic acid-binding protein